MKINISPINNELVQNQISFGDVYNQEPYTYIVKSGIFPQYFELIVDRVFNYDSRITDNNKIIYKLVEVNERMA